MPQSRPKYVFGLAPPWPTVGACSGSRTLAGESG